MTIQVTLYDTSTLLGVYSQMEEPTSYWRDLTTSGVVTSEDEYIDFQKITKTRKLAPLIVPTAQGKPIYAEGSRTQRMKPAYLKPKDPVSPGRVIKRRPGESLFAPNAQSPSARFNSILADILTEHRDSIERREEWMTARGVIDGKLTLEGPDYPTRVVDFERDPSHTVTLSTSFWDDPDHPIMDDLNAWIERVRRAKFGGVVTRVTVGSDVVGPMLRNKQVKEQLDLNTRGTSANLNTGLRNGEYVQYHGLIGPGVELWSDSSFYELPDGSSETYLDAKTVVLTSPSINVVRCFGAILDDKANFQAMAAFPKMWTNDDPSVTFVMTQSAPLPVVVNPNASLSAKVLA